MRQNERPSQSESGVYRGLVAGESGMYTKSWKETDGGEQSTTGKRREMSWRG